MIMYKITVNKDMELVTVEYHLHALEGSGDVISSFSLEVAGRPAFERSAQGEHEFFGIEHLTLADETKDAEVWFSLTSVQGFQASGDDVLKGEQPFDGTAFSN